MPDGTRLMILAPVIRDRKGEYLAVFDEIRRQGFVRVRVDGEVRDLDETITLAKNKKHTIEVVVDRVIVRHDEGRKPDDNPDRVRIIDSLETALRIGNGAGSRPGHRWRGSCASPRSSPASIAG